MVVSIVENNIDNNEQQKLSLHKINAQKNMTDNHLDGLRNFFAVSALIIATSLFYIEGAK